MQRRTKLLLVLLLSLIGIGVVAYWLLIPQIVSFLPADQAAQVAADREIEITFNYAIQFDPQVEYLSIDPPNAGTYSYAEKTLTFHPTLPWTADQTYTVQVNNGIRSSFGILLLQRPQWKFNVKHPWLVFLLDSPERTEIYQIDPSGLQTRRLIETDESVLDYFILPDGHEIIYMSKDDDDTKIIWYNLEDNYGQTIYTCDNQLCSQPGLSTDAKYLSFAIGASPQDMNPNASRVMVAALNGKAIVGEPLPAAGNNHSTRDPDWSAAGWLKYYDDTDNSYIFYQPGKGSRVALQHDTGELGSWSKDGAIFFYPRIFLPAAGSRSLTDYSSQILGYIPETNETTYLTRNDTTEDVLPIVSPDGKRVAFSRRYLTEDKWTPGRQLWIIRTDGNNPIGLTSSDDYSHFDYCWSPDNTRIAYERFNTADYNQDREVWMMDIKTGIAQKILINGYRLGWLP